MFSSETSVSTLWSDCGAAFSLLTSSVTTVMIFAEVVRTPMMEAATLSGSMTWSFYGGDGGDGGDGGLIIQSFKESIA